MQRETCSDEAHPREGWTRSLRRETTLQDQFRRAIHAESGGVANVGFARWNAASCLQEQIDSARGVEHMRRLAKSRAINARFCRRSVMKDLQGTDLQHGTADPLGTTGCPSPKGRSNSSLEQGASGGVHNNDFRDDEASQTRVQALERFGIDLSRVGVMTTERTASRLLRATTGDNGVLEAGRDNASRNATSTPQTGEINGSTRYDRKRDTRGSFDGTTSAGLLKSASETHQSVVAAKLKALDMLLQDDPVSDTPSVDVGRYQDAHVNKDYGDDAMGKEESATGVVGAGVVGDEVAARDRTNFSSLATSYAGVAESGPSGNIPDGGLSMSDAEGTVSHAKRQQEFQSGGSAVEKGYDTLKYGEVTSKAFPEEREEKRDLPDKALPSHRPCWWWVSLVSPGTEGICVPDMVTLAPASPHGNHILPGNDLPAQGGNTDRPASPTTHTPASAAQTPHRENAKIDTMAANRCARQPLLWTFSTLDNSNKTKADDGSSGAHGGVLEDSIAPRSHGVRRAPQRRMNSTGENNPTPRIKQEQRLQTEEITGDDGLLRAARGICACARRGGGGGERWQGGDKQLALPLALLKVWGHKDDVGGKGGHLPGGNGRRGRRRLSVVALWTETEVLEALRDMVKRRWGRPKNLQGNNNAHTTRLNIDEPTTSCPAATSSPAVTSNPWTSTTTKLTSSSSTPAAATTTTTITPSSRGVARTGTPRAVGSIVQRGQYAFLTSSTNNDEDACCVQAFVKSVVLSSDTTALKSAASEDVLHNGPTPRSATATPPSTARAGDGDDEYRASHPNPLGKRRRKRGAAASSAAVAGLVGPLFYRAAWRRTGGKVVAWKIASRYPYVSNLAAHLCPLVGAGSRETPFIATTAERAAVEIATVNMENLSKILRRAFDPTLQSVWADWAVSEADGQWFLVEVHGMKTDEDARAAVAATTAVGVVRDVKPKVFIDHQIPPSHFCGDTDDLRERIATAKPTQGLCFAEMAKILGTISKKRQPCRPPTPSKVSDNSRKALTRRGGRDRLGTAGRRMANQYWRCAGDFCETRQGGQGQALGCNNPLAAGSHEVDIRKTHHVEEGRDEETNNRYRTMAGGQETGSVGDGGTDDILGRRKHALAVEIPRTVLFRLVLNARAVLLGWRASAADFAMMEKPVQLCSACYSVCNALERQRIETTRRAMEAEETCAREGKERRDRRPPGWKSRVQHELEDSLGADRQVVSKLILKFHDAAAISSATKKKTTASINNNTAAVSETSKRPSSSSQPKYNAPSPTPRGRGRNGGGGGSRVGRSGQHSGGRTRDWRGGEVTGVEAPTAEKQKSTMLGSDRFEEEECEGAARKGAIMSSTMASARLESENTRTVPRARCLRSAREAETPTTATTRYVASLSKEKTPGQNQNEQQLNRQQQAYKREVRARRKAKERARRRAQPADSRGQEKHNAERRQKQNEDDHSSNIDDRRSPRKKKHHNAPKILPSEPIAPMLLEITRDQGGEGEESSDVGDRDGVRRISDRGSDSDNTITQNATTVVIGRSDSGSASAGDLGGSRLTEAAETLIASDKNNEPRQEQRQERRQNVVESEYCSEYGDDFEDDASIPPPLYEAQHV